MELVYCVFCGGKIPTHYLDEGHVTCRASCHTKLKAYIKESARESKAFEDELTRQGADLGPATRIRTYMASFHGTFTASPVRSPHHSIMAICGPPPDEDEYKKRHGPGWVQEWVHDRREYYTNWYGFDVDRARENGWCGPA